MFKFFVFLSIVFFQIKSFACHMPIHWDEIKAAICFHDDKVSLLDFGESNLDRGGNIESLEVSTKSCGGKDNYEVLNFAEGLLYGYTSRGDFAITYTDPSMELPEGECNNPGPQELMLVGRNAPMKRPLFRFFFQCKVGYCLPLADLNGASACIPKKESCSL